MRFEPHEYQRHCIDRLISDPAIGLFLRPGLGKTAITLTAIWWLKYRCWSVRKVLVIAPKKVAEATWQNEAGQWDHLRDLRISTILGSADQRRAAMHADADVYIINRDNTEWLIWECGVHWPFDMVVLDESTSFKNPQSKRFKALKKVRPKIRRVVLLTGTPSGNSLMDLWAQIWMLDSGERLGRTLSGYRERYFEPDKRNAVQIWSYKPKPDAEQAIMDKISDICVSLTADDYLELPDYVSHVVPVVLDAKAKKAYARLEEDLLLETDDAVITALSAAVLTNKLLQFCSGAIYDDQGRPSEVHSCKIDACLELLEQLGEEHCLIYYGYQHDRDRLLKAIKGKRVRVYQSSEDADAWNRGDVDVLLAHPASCAYGLNLQAGGCHIIWFGLNWSYELNDQGNCRLYRQGSPYDKVFVHYLVVQGAMDEAVYKAAQARRAANFALMDALKLRICEVIKDRREGKSNDDSNSRSDTDQL